MLKGNKARIRRLEAREEEKLLQSASQKLRQVIILTLETAMRRGGILNIKKSHINYSRSVLLIPCTKTDQARTIPIWKPNRKPKDLSASSMHSNLWWSTLVTVMLPGSRRSTSRSIVLIGKRTLSPLRYAGRSACSQRPLTML